MSIIENDVNSLLKVSFAGNITCVCPFVVLSFRAIMGTLAGVTAVVSDIPVGIY
jgi:hypothetical protein